MDKSDASFEFVSSIYSEGIEVISDPGDSIRSVSSVSEQSTDDKDILFKSRDKLLDIADLPSLSVVSQVKTDGEKKADLDEKTEGEGKADGDETTERKGKAEKKQKTERKGHAERNEKTEPEAKIERKENTDISKTGLEQNPTPRSPRRRPKKSPYAHCEQVHQEPTAEEERMDFDGIYEYAWRKTVNWQDRELERKNLKEQITDYEPLREFLIEGVSFPHVNILLFGAVGAGKSSVFNTMNSVFRGRIFNVARSGISEHSLTTKFTRYPMLTERNVRENMYPTRMKFNICDMRGLEADHLMSKENMRYILEGNIANKFPVDPSGNISQDMPGFNRHPKLEDRIHCVAIVQDATTVDAMQDLSPEINKNIKAMQTLINSLDIPQVVILTKVDQICEDTERNVAFAFRSPQIEKCVSKVSEMMGLPRNNVFPMKNYEKEYQLDPSVDIVALLTLKGILNCCDAHLFNFYEDIRQQYSVT